MIYMQTIEALISLLVFLSILPLILSSIEPHVPDDALYRLHLANDIWRVFYLRGDFEDFDKAALNRDAEQITKLTGLCIGFEEEDVTSCIGESEFIRIKKIAIIDGNPKWITMMVSVKK